MKCDDFLNWIYLCFEINFNCHVFLIESNPCWSVFQIFLQFIVDFPTVYFIHAVSRVLKWLDLKFLNTSVLIALLKYLDVLNQLFVEIGCITDVYHFEIEINSQRFTGCQRINLKLHFVRTSVFELLAWDQNLLCICVNNDIEWYRRTKCVF